MCKEVAENNALCTLYEPYLECVVDSGAGELMFMIAQESRKEFMGHLGTWRMPM